MKIHEQIRIEEVSSEALREFLLNVPMTEILDSWDSLSAEEQLKVFLSLELDTKVDLVNEFFSAGTGKTH